MSQGSNPFADYHWRVEFDGYPPVTTDEMTLDEVEMIERVTDTPWVNLNPRASMKVAKAMVVVLAMRAGMAENEAFEQLGSMNLKSIKRTFIFVEGDAGDRPPAKADSDPPSLAPTSATG